MVFIFCAAMELAARVCTPGWGIMGTPWGPHSPSLKGWGIESQKTPGWGIWSPKTPGFRGGFRHFGGLEEMDLLNIDISLHQLKA